MPLPQQVDPAKLQALIQSKGLNPNEWTLSDDGTKLVPQSAQPQSSEAGQEINYQLPQLPQLPDDNAQTGQPVGMPLQRSSAIGTLGRSALEAAPSAAASGLGAAGGLALAGSLGLAPETGGLSLLALPLVLGGGYAAGKGASAIQNAVESDQHKQELAQAQAEHPIAAMAGQLAAMPLGGLSPNINNVGRAGSGLLKLATGVGATPEELAHLGNVGIGTAIGAVQPMVEGDFSPKDIAMSAAEGAAFNSPNAIGKRLGFHPVVPRDITDPQKYAAMMRQQQTVHTADDQMLNINPTVMSDVNTTIGGIPVRQDVRTEGRSKADLANNAMARFAMDRTPQGQMDAMAAEGGIVPDDGTPDVEGPDMSAEQKKILDYYAALKERAAQMQQEELDQHTQDLQQKMQENQIPAGDNVTGKAIISPLSKQAAQNLRESPEDLENRNIENKLAGQPKDKYNSQSATLTPAGEALMQLAQERGLDVTSISPEYFNTVAKEVSALHGVTDSPVAGLQNQEGKEVLGTAHVGTGKSSINPNLADVGTQFHENFHHIYAAMSPAERATFNKAIAPAIEQHNAQRVANGQKPLDVNNPAHVEEFGATEMGYKTVARLLNANGETPIKRWWNDLKASWKSKYGKEPSLDDVYRANVYKLVNGISRVRGGNVSGLSGVGAKVEGEQKNQENNLPLNSEWRQDQRDEIESLYPKEAKQNVNPAQNQNVRGRVSEEQAKAGFASVRSAVANKNQEEGLFSTKAKEMLKGATTGRFFGDQLLGTIKNAVTPTEWQVYKDAGIEQALGGQRLVDKHAALQWLEQNTPKVEVRKFGEGGMTPEAKEYNQLDHEFDGTSIKTGIRAYADGRITKEQFIHTYQPDQNVLSKVDRYKTLWEKGVYDNTGKDAHWSFVAPKAEKDMPGYVEIAVVRGHKWISADEQRKLGWKRTDNQPAYAPDDIAFPSSHNFPPNTLGFVRGYMETNAKGEKVFHVIEVQSDWAQQARPEMSGPDSEGKYTAQIGSEGYRGNTPEEAKAYAQRVNRLQDPLLPHYERLALKAAIDHARKEGATKIAISDAETAMMSEGHDRTASRMVRYEDTKEQAQKIANTNPDYYLEKDGIGWRVMSKNVVTPPTQEGGMRLHYDRTLPKIAEELTGSKGERVEMGEHEKAMEEPMPSNYAAGINQRVLDRELTPTQARHLLQRGPIAEPRKDLIFKNPDGTPKTSVTARVYPLEKVSSELEGGRKFTMFNKFQETGLKEGEKKPLTPAERYAKFIAKKNADLAQIRGVSKVGGKVGGQLHTQPEDRIKMDTITPSQRIIIDRTVAKAVGKRIISMSGSDRPLEYIKKQDLDEIRSNVLQKILTGGIDKDGLQRTIWRRTNDAIDEAREAYKKQPKGVSLDKKKFEDSDKTVGDTISQEHVAESAPASEEDLKSLEKQYSGGNNTGDINDVSRKLVGKQTEREEEMPVIGDFLDRIEPHMDRFTDEQLSKIKPIFDELADMPQHEPVPHEAFDKIMSVMKGEKNQTTGLPKEGSDRQKVNLLWLRSELDSARTKAGQAGEPAARALGEFPNVRNEYFGKYASPIVEKIHKMPVAEANKVDNILTQESIDKKSYRGLLTSDKQRELYDTIRERLKQKQLDQIKAGEKITDWDSKGKPFLRDAKIDPWYYPSFIKPKALETLLERKAGYKQIEKQLLDHWQQQGATPEYAKQKLEQLMNIEDGAKPNEVRFGANRKAEGMGLPKELRLNDAEKTMTRYFNRVATDRAWHDVVEKNPEAMKVLSKESEVAHHFNGIVSSIKGEPFDKNSSTIGAFNRVVTSAMLGPMTNIHIGWSTLFNPFQYVKGSELVSVYSKALAHMSESNQNALKNGYLRRDTHGLRDVVDSGNTFIQKMAGLSSVIGKLNGRQWTDLASKTVAQALGEEIVPLRILGARNGDEWSMNVVKQLDPYWTPEKQYSKEEMSQMASTLGGMIHGAHDYRTLPELMTKESVVKPFLSLMSWSVSQTNQWMKHVWEPATKGNIQPLIMSTLGAAVGGYVIQQLRQMIQDKKGNIPSFTEIANSSRGVEGNIPLLAYNFMQMASFTGFAGLGSALGKDVFDLAYKNLPQGANFPLDVGVENVGETIAEATSAWLQNPTTDNFLSIMPRAVLDMAKENFQLGRIALSWAANYGVTGETEAYKKNLSTQEGELRRWKMAEGLPYEQQVIPNNNPYANIQAKTFKQTSNMQEAAQNIPQLIQLARERSQGNPDVMRSVMEGFKQNSYQTMPSPESMPLQFGRYYQYLVRTLGPEQAQAAMKDYMTHNAINQMKSSMLPRL